jgi:hypothetical protein
MVVGGAVSATRPLPVEGAAEAKTGIVTARITRKRRIACVKRGCMRNLLVPGFYPVRIYRLRYAIGKCKSYEMVSPALLQPRPANQSTPSDPPHLPMNPGPSSLFYFPVVKSLRIIQ